MHAPKTLQINTIGVKEKAEIDTIRLGPEFQWAPSARILRTRVSISTLSNSSEKERLEQQGPGYIHIMATRRQSG
jgi:hypothetical protein